MKYEEYLDKFCSNETFWRQSGNVYGLKLPWRIRFKIWRLKRKGYLVRVEVDYHYEAGIFNEVDALKVASYGFVRIHKYKLHETLTDGLKPVEGGMGE